MTDIGIIGAPQSPFVRAVCMACDEKDVAYLLTPSMPHMSEVDQIHHLGKITVMRYGDYQLCESKGIATFVDRAFARRRQTLRQSRAMGVYNEYSDYSDGDPLFWSVFFP